MSALKTSKLDPSHAQFDTVVPAGEPWLGRITRGHVLRIVDLEGNQAVDTLFFRADAPYERYSASDTIRMQGGLYLTTGTVLRSNAGSAMLSIVDRSRNRRGPLTPSSRKSPPSPRGPRNIRYIRKVSAPHLLM